MKYKSLALIFLALVVISSCKKKEEDALTVLNKSLVLYYPFNGDAVDGGPNHIDGTLKNGIKDTTDHLGNANCALWFNGDSAFVQAAPSSVLDNLVRPFTCSAWLRIDDWYLSTQQFSPIYCKSSIPNDSVQLRLMYSNSNKHYFCSPYTCGEFASSFLPILHSWFNISIVEDISEIRLYINGELKNTYPCSNQVYRNKYPLLIGCDPEGITEYLKGAVDEFKIYNKALSSEEVLLIQ